MEESSMRLDGNACAGLLSEIFAQDLTAARGACSACGTVAQVGSQYLYDYPAGPGAVLRCGTCQGVLMVLVDTGARYRLGIPGMTWLEIER